MFKIVYHHNRDLDEVWTSLFEGAKSDKGNLMKHTDRAWFVGLIDEAKSSVASDDKTYCLDEFEPDYLYRCAVMTWQEESAFIEHLMLLFAEMAANGKDPFEKENPDDLMSTKYFWGPFELASDEFAKAYNDNPAGIDNGGEFVKDAWLFVLRKACIGKSGMLFSKLVEEIEEYFYDE